MKKLLLAVVLCALALSGWAAMSDYSFEQSASAYADLTAPTVIHGPGVDDSMSPVFEIGFNFMLDETPYTQFKANSNGFITLNPASSASLSNNLTAQTLIIAAIWDDLKTNDGDGQVAYQLSGTAPNRVLTVEYKNLKWYYSVSPVNLVNFQIKLYEGTNRIEIIYGTMGTAPGTSASATIGVSGAVLGNFMSVTPASPTATTSTTVSFNSVNDTHIAFMTGKKYSFIPPVAANNDLAATGITGNVTPSVNAPTTYTVSIYNRGANAQSTYTVQIINAAGTVLASAPGTQIASGATIQVPVSWTPTAEGPVAIRGKVVLAGDENAANDITSPLSISVMPAGIVVVTVGDGSQNIRMPLDFYFRNSLNQTLYFPDELGMFGNITAISLYNNFSTTTLQNMPTKIWMGSTALTDLSAGWIPASDLTLVYDGTVSYPGGENTILIPLQTTYAYSGGNLVIMFNRPMDTTYYSSVDYFKGQTVGTNRARNVFSDSTTYDPNNPGAVGTVTGQFAKTSLHMTPLSPDPIFSIMPPSANYGTVLLDTTQNRTFTVLNAGGGTLTINNISIAGSEHFSLQNLPTLPASLTTGQNITFVGRYNPTAAGTHTATISVTDDQGNRTVHTVALTGQCIDTTIMSLPYTQAFDGVTAPALPIDWSSIITGGTSAAVVTYTSAPHSAPNSVRIYNGSPAASNTMLVAPPLSNTIATNTVRMKLWVKGTGATYTLSFGVMTDPLDPSTYTEVQNITTPTAWTEFVIPFNGYTGAGRYIAIKHGNVSSGQTIYVDDVILELIAANDLGVTALSGNTTPSVNNPTTYTASIFNWGTNAQSTYSVKLYNAAGTELATAAGVNVAPGETVEVPISWTPSAEGPVTIYAKVILGNDLNPGNDQSPNLNITVMPAGIVVVTVGDGSQNIRMPLDFFYKNSINQTLYFPTELGMYGNITAITLYNQFTTATLQNMPTKIWMSTTDLNDLATDWIPATQMTLVFDGTVNYPAGANDILIPLQVPFAYSAGNLVVMFNRPMDTVYYSSADQFKGQTVGTTRARNMYSDSTTYDPNAPTDGTVTGQFAKTSFHMTPLSDEPMFSISPASANYGTALINTTVNRTFTILNVGGGTLTINNISIAGSEFFSLQNLPTLPVSLTTGQSTTFVGRYNPTAAGAHTATITVTDSRGNRSQITFGSRESSNRMPHTVALSGNCIDTTVNALPYVQNFDGITAPALPLDWSSLITPTSSTAVVVTYTSTPHSDPNCVRIYNGSTANTYPHLIAPPLATTIPINTTRVKFWLKGAAATYQMQVGVMTDPLDAGTFTSVETITPTTAWAEYIVALNGYTGTGRYIAFKHMSTATGQTFYLDDARVEVIAANDLGALSISGNATPTAGMANVYTVNIKNWGTNAQNTYTVKIFNSGGTELATAPGVAVAPGVTVPVSVSWTPVDAGAVTIYGKVFLTGDQAPDNDQSPNLNVLVNPAGVFTLTVGEGNQTARIPVDMFYKNSLFETLYYPAEMANFIGQINGIQFYNNFPSDLLNMPTKVWIGTTTLTDLSAGWIPSTDLTLVFDGTVNYPTGQNIITIPFNDPYLYLNGENLVLMVNRPMDTQYYSSTSYFQAQTVGTNRARNIYSDGTTYDPASPGTVGTVSGQFPKTTFMVIPGGVGHVNGTVLGAGNQPLAGVSVSINNGAYSTTTNTAGQYQIMNVLPNTYSVSFSKHTYQTLTQTFTLEEDETEVINVTMTLMAQVSMSGTVLASDTGAGISGAAIQITGYEDYSANTNAAGVFTFPAVFANQTYQYIISAAGYTSASGTVNVGGTNHNMGNITLNEVAFAPVGITAVANDTNSSVNITWLAPDPNALEITESFEEDVFPPAEWTRTITNQGAANPQGVYPTWCRVGAFSISGEPVTPTDGNFQAGLYWDYSHQDEWLITPGFNCPPSAYLSFDGYVFLGSTNQDHYYVKVSADNGNTWTVLWDASAQTGGWNYYASPITVDLSLYTGQQIKLAFHAVDGPGNDGLWYVWFIDNIYIGNSITNISFSSDQLQAKSKGLSSGWNSSMPMRAASRIREEGGLRNEPRLPYQNEIRYAPRSERVLTGYKVWRLPAGQEGNEASWTLVTPDMITALTTDDAGWAALPNGNYRWAVKAIYTNGVSSVGALSNVLNKDTVTGMIAGVVRRQNTTPIVGATITVAGLTATTNSAGAYTLVVPVGTHSVTASATGFVTQTVENVTVSQNLTTTVNFVMVQGTDSDDPQIPVTATALNGNFPNPFNPETTISYSVREAGPVKIEIYNLKGQLVRSLVQEDQASGHYKVVFDGRDNRGASIASGVYMIRMSTPNYQSSKKMILMQ